jgi:hypothetical protein
MHCGRCLAACLWELVVVDGMHAEPLLCSSSSLYGCRRVVVFAFAFEDDWGCPVVDMPLPGLFWSSGLGIDSVYSSSTKRCHIWRFCILLCIQPCYEPTRLCKLAPLLSAYMQLHKKHSMGSFVGGRVGTCMHCSSLLPLLIRCTCTGVVIMCACTGVVIWCACTGVCSLGFIWGQAAASAVLVHLTARSTQRIEITISTCMRCCWMCSSCDAGVSNSSRDTLLCVPLAAD